MRAPLMMTWLIVVLIPALILMLLAGITWRGQSLIERRYPPIGDRIEIDGSRLHYVVAGEGPPILLLHGASSNLRDFQASLLPELARTHRVIAFDRPGHGYSDRLPGEWADPARVIDVLLRACEQLGLERPLVVGHSWAGSLVMSALVHQPERVAGGVLLGGVAGHWAGSVGWTYDIGGLPLLGRLFAWTLVYPVGRGRLDAAAVDVFAPDPVPAGYVDDIAIPLALRPRPFLHNVEDMRRLNEYMQTLSPRYDEIRLPLLFIHGDADTLVPWWNHGRRVLPVVPQAEVLLIPGGGHAPQHAHTMAVAAAIRRHVADPPAQAANPRDTLSSP